MHFFVDLTGTVTGTQINRPFQLPEKNCFQSKQLVSLGANDILLGGFFCLNLNSRPLVVRIAIKFFNHIANPAYPMLKRGTIEVFVPS